MRFHELRAQRPIAHIPEMFLKRRTQTQFLPPTTTYPRWNWYKDLAIRVRPIQTHSGGIRDEELVKGDGRVGAGELVAHAGEREVVDPTGVGVEELEGAGCAPGGEAIVVLGGGGDAVAHYEEHDVAGLGGLVSADLCESEREIRAGGEKWGLIDGE